MQISFIEKDKKPIQEMSEMQKTINLRALLSYGKYNFQSHDSQKERSDKAKTLALEGQKVSSSNEHRALAINHSKIQIKRHTRTW